MPPIAVCVCNNSGRLRQNPARFTRQVCTAATQVVLWLNLSPFLLMERNNNTTETFVASSLLVFLREKKKKKKSASRIASCW